jgi:general secretion pathway protein D
VERSKVIFWVVVSMASAFIVYWVGFHPPVDGSARAAPEPNAVGQSDAPGDVNMPQGPPEANEPGETADINEPSRPADANAPSDANAPADANAPTDANSLAEPNEPGGSKEPMEAVNLKEFEMKNIMEKLASWTGKTIIPSDDAMKLKITIYASEKLPRSKALANIYSALRMKGIIAETVDDTIFLKPIAEAKLGQVPTIAPGQPLALIENKEQIVQKFFELKNYSPTKMLSVVQPLIGEYGHVSADENARSLLVIETVSNLMRLEHIINQFDIPEAEPTVTEIFEVRYGDPSEIVQMLNILLAGGAGRSSGRSSSDRSRSSYDRGGYGGGGFYGPRPNPEPSASSSSSSRKTSSTGPATSVVIGTVEGPVILIPEPRRKWIIARASPQVMEQIRIWIDKLDKEKPVESEYEIVNLRYADPREVESSIGDGFRDMPGTEFLPSILIQPLSQTKQVIVFGKKDLREIVKKMIAEIDVAPGMFETRRFPLKYADPDQIKTMIEELFGQSSASSSASRYTYVYNYGGGSRGSSTSVDTVKVISYVTLKQVTVIASPEKMVDIAKQIEDWDKPLDVDAVKPRIIELKNSDPVEMADLLNTLFSEKTTSRVSIFDIMFGSGSQDKEKIIGPLYGQLTFEDVPGTKKIIVISKIPEAYDVVEQLVLDLDREEMAEVPKVITVKYADPEDLSERLNAMFVEAGQQARIRLTTQGLSGASSMTDSTSSGSSSGSSSSNTSNSANASTNTYTPPWSGSGARSTVDQQMPISNVIGRIRFVPDPHTKSIMCLAPPEFMDEIEQLIADLDKPGKQVLIQAIIVEIEHTKMTSLGIELATNPSAFGTLSENAITALLNITSVGTDGSPAPTGRISPATGTMTATGSGTILGVGTDVYTLIDFLVKKTNARILNQQSLWTKDNEEASFFKGSEVAFIAGTTQAVNVGTTQNITFERVGMELRARPSITPEDKVDMIVNVQISQLTSDIVNTQPVRSKMNTTTNMIVQDAQTLLLGGILFQKDSLVQRKLPGLGDLPGIGGLFRHEQVIKSNSELLVFITPRVIDENMENVSEATRAVINQPRETLKKALGELDTALEGLDQ